MAATAADGKVFAMWCCNMVDNCVQATGASMAQLSKLVLNLCEAINSVPEMSVFRASVLEHVGPWAANFLDDANKIVTGCVPEFVTKLQEKFQSKLLRQQAWFHEVCAAEEFLPVNQPSAFWDKCAQWPLPQEMKANVPCECFSK